MVEQRRPSAAIVAGEPGAVGGPDEVDADGCHGRASGFGIGLDQTRQAWRAVPSRASPGLYAVSLFRVSSPGTPTDPRPPRSPSTSAAPLRDQRASRSAPAPAPGLPGNTGA